MKKVLSVLLIIFVLAGCSSGETQNAGESGTNNLVVTTSAVEKSYREAGQKYVNGFPDNFSKIGDLYEYPLNEISYIIVGKWEGIDDYECIWDIEFTKDGKTTFVGKSGEGSRVKNDKSNETGEWEVTDKYLVITNTNGKTTTPDGKYYVYALQDEKHILLYQWRPTDFPDDRYSLQAYILEKKD